MQCEDVELAWDRFNIKKHTQKKILNEVKNVKDITLDDR